MKMKLIVLTVIVALAAWAITLVYDGTKKATLQVAENAEKQQLRTAAPQTNGSSTKSLNAMGSAEKGAAPINLERARQLLHSLNIHAFKGHQLPNGMYLSMQGNYLGSIDPIQFEEQPAVAVANYLGTLEPLTGLAADKVEVVTLNLQPGFDGGNHVRYKQIIDGIPVDSSFRISTDAIGSVTSVSLMLFDPDTVADFQVTSSAALQAAKTALASALDVPQNDLVFQPHEHVSASGEANAQYELRTGGGELPEARPQWIVQYYAAAPGKSLRSYKILVDGLTGDTRFQNTRMSFTADVCEPEGSVYGTVPENPPILKCEDQTLDLGGFLRSS